MRRKAFYPAVALDYQSQSTIRVNADLLVVLAIVLVLVVVLVLDFSVFAALRSQVTSNQ